MVKIIIDSAADFEPHEIEAMDVTCIPLSVIFGEDSYKENLEITKAEFYHLLETSEHFPHTSQPSPQEFAAAYEEAKQNGDETVVITISTGLSGTYQGAVLAKELCDYEDCYVIDSLNGTGGIRLLIEHAVKLRDEGKSAREIYDEIEVLKHRINLYACLDTLEYLYRGGRISHLAATIGSVANIKPILHVSEDGKACIPAKLLGKRRGLQYMLRQLEAKLPDPRFPVYVMYTHIRENAEMFANVLREKGYEIAERQLINVGAVVGTHIGANAFGIVYVMAE